MFCWTITITPDIPEHGPLLYEVKNPSNSCVVGSYPPATKTEKCISDVRCTCPYCCSILTWEEMNENVSLYNRDFITNELRTLHGQELKSCKNYSWNECDGKHCDPVPYSKTVKQRKIKGNVSLSSFKNNKTMFLLPWCLSLSVSILCRNDSGVLRKTCFLICMTASSKNAS